MIHYMILIMFVITTIVFGAIKGIKSPEVFIIFNALFCIAHPFVYLMLTLLKEYKYHSFKGHRYGIPCIAIQCVLGVLLLYLYFKLPDNGFNHFWWLYDLLIVLIFIVPIITFYILGKVKPEKKPTLPFRQK